MKLYLFIAWASGRARDPLVTKVNSLCGCKIFTMLYLHRIEGENNDGTRLGT